MIDFLSDDIYNTGVYQYGFLGTNEIKFREEIRTLCTEGGCGYFGKTWACPPAVGTVEECKERCLTYDTMLVFSGLSFVEDSFDIEGTKEGLKGFKGIAQKMDLLFSQHTNNYLVLSNEGCHLCSECTYPKEPCRNPDKLHHSIEGYGLLVSELTNEAGLDYDSGFGTVTFFGALLFNKAEVKAS